MTTIAVACGMCRAADAMSSCSPALSEVDVEQGFKVRVDCGLPARTVSGFSSGLSHAAKEGGLSDAQKVSLASAANVMLGALHVPADGGQHEAEAALAHLEGLVQSLAATLRTQPDADLLAKARDWSMRYADLLHRMSIKGSSTLSIPAALPIDDALHRFDLDQAATLMSGLLAKQDTATTQAASARFFDAAEIGLLRFKPQDALPYLTKAYALQPDDTAIASAFADTLREQREPEQAEVVYRALLTRYEALAQTRPALYRPDVARTLNSLGALYVMLQRPADAERAWLRALEIDWALARDNPPVYGPAVAELFDNLGALYRDTQRLKDATDAYHEALDINRALSSRDPATYRPVVATTLNDIGILYGATQRSADAEHAYR
ncbi:MAG TPA: tetratricopeptide repeat protein, partial [Paraburkholderia sp.]|nr:tetratricopeptide repeat protein [Paraburkholderia sp.]